MKTTLMIGAVLAASQCMPEPSDRAETSPPAADAGSAAAPDAASAAATDVGEDVAGAEVSSKTAARLLAPGPPPFTVPTAQIAWPQKRAMVRAPQGTRLEADGDRALVTLGEGYNFAFHVAPAGQAAAPEVPEDATVDEREDNSQMWFRDGRWFFSGTFGGFSCWNDAEAKHDRDDVEMMLASCKSIVQESSQ